MELKGSKTEANLMAAFAGESQARNKYDYFASRAKKDGYEQIAAIFQETALNEKEHAKMWFKLFAGIDGTKENLLAAAAGEHEEWTDIGALPQARQEHRVGRSVGPRRQEQMAVPQLRRDRRVRDRAGEMSGL